MTSGSCGSTRSRCCRSAGTTWATTSATGSRSARKADPDKLPKIFNVNWFRKDADGKFLWPGYGENSRVLAWVFRRCEGTAEASETPVGNVPRPEDIETEGLDVSPEHLAEVLRVDPEDWRKELPAIKEHFARFGDRLPDGAAQAAGRARAAAEERLGGRHARGWLTAPAGG